MPQDVQRSGYFRVRYVGPGQGRYEAPHAFVPKIAADRRVRETIGSIGPDPPEGFSSGSA